MGAGEDGGREMVCLKRSGGMYRKCGRGGEKESLRAKGEEGGGKGEGLRAVE